MNSPRLFLGSLAAMAAFTLGGCTAFKEQVAPNPRHVVQDGRPRKLFVFMDGTANDWQTRTNVRRMFELVAAQEDPHRLCFWVEGVGTEHDILGLGFGLGLKERVEAAYTYLAQNYHPGDDIYVFGFSRGAWEARTLCGLLAHAGLYKPAGNEKVPAEEIFQKVADLPEEQWPSLSKEEQQRRNATQLAANNQAMKSTAPFGSRLQQPVKVKFLGIWDTVAGFQITKIDGEGEQTKRVNGVLTPRYKVKPYPNIERIAHAMAIDEERSQFRPTRVGPPLDPEKTSVFEVWFPGVHSDIGGGYGDSNAMAGLSLNWMLQLLGPDKLIPGKYVVAADYAGIMHHSELDRFGAFGSQPVPRVLPQGAMVHESFLKRVETPKLVPEDLPLKKDVEVYTRYRPEVPMQELQADGTRKKPIIPFVLKPEGSTEDTPEARLNWKFDSELWRKNFLIVSTAQARSRPVLGKPLTANATVIQDSHEKPLPATAPKAKAGTATAGAAAPASAKAAATPPPAPTSRVPAKPIAG